MFGIWCEDEGKGTNGKMKDIYSNLRGEVFNRTLGKIVQLFDGDCGLYNPSLIIWNKLELQMLIKYLTSVEKEWDEK